MVNNTNRANGAIVKMLEQLPDLLAAATTSEERANLMEKAANLKKELVRAVKVSRGAKKKHAKRPKAYEENPNLGVLANWTLEQEHNEKYGIVPTPRREEPLDPETDSEPAKTPAPAKPSAPGWSISR